MKIHLQYGKEGLNVEIPTSNVTVVAPKFLEGLPDEAAGFQAAVRAPINAKPLKELISAKDKVAIVIPDITRPLPTDRLLPWIFAELSHVPAENFVIVNGTGSHRVNTPEELDAMVGKGIAKKYRIVNHNSLDPATLAPAGKTSDGFPVLMNKEYVQADKRIVMGFIEPHFMAGFSGGYKGIFPAVADIASIMRYHDAKTIGDPKSTWGVLEGNPTQRQIRENGSVLPVHFCINVTQNHKRQITRFFCGDPMAAHVAGCAFSKSTVMVPCKKAFPIVVTTNSGYPLDQNLYQAVKGMSAGAQIIEQDGFILSASKCNDGFPSHGNFKKLLFEAPNARALLDRILAPGFSMYDQWEAQLLAIICLKARVGLVSDIAPDEVRKAHLEPVTDITARLAEELKRRGKDAPIAVLPEGPMAIPYLE
ncbi:MAG TPA: nickel-dependent lactate racemase [Planctomycetota bacterium]|nr:nickel-dependent lactate racemase [Planctomycetota bacterium]